MGGIEISKVLNTQPKERPEPIEEVFVAPDQEHELILYNDDVNTFDHVIIVQNQFVLLIWSNKHLFYWLWTFLRLGI